MANIAKLFVTLAGVVHSLALDDQCIGMGLGFVQLRL
jgi:hypothetical protein